MNKHTLFVRNTRRADDGKTVVLAFQASDDVSPVSVHGQAIGWTGPAMLAMKDLQREAQVRYGREPRNLPYASLRGLFEVMVPGVLRINQGMGLDKWALGQPPAPQFPAFLWTDAQAATVAQAVTRALDEWLPNYLVETFAKAAEVSAQYVDRIYTLHQQQQLFSMRPHQARILPWQWSQETGTTRALSAVDYGAMADYVARLLAGHELFAGCGPMRRILVVTDPSSGAAALMTKPIRMDGKGDFSLLLRLEIVTFPAVHQPVLRLELSKRRWLQSLPEDTFDGRNVSGYMFPAAANDRSPGFSVTRRRGQDGGYYWDPDNAFHALKSFYRLPLEHQNADSIARGFASTSDCEVRLSHRYGLEEVGSVVKAGVPELDKLEAFEKAGAILSSCGLKPFGGFLRVKTTHTVPSLTARMINTTTLLNAALESRKAASIQPAMGFTVARLSEIGEAELDRILQQAFQFGLSAIPDRDRSNVLELKDQTKELQSLVQGNAEAVRRYYGEKQPQLVVLYDSAETPSVRLLNAAIRQLWGEAFEIKLQRLPEAVHGPKRQLPGAALKAAERFTVRVDAWRALARSIASAGRNTLCLVMAPHMYADPATGRRQVDDPVNKPAARKALATLAGATVQYLLPLKSRQDSSIDLPDFLHRLQSAMKDLVFAHAGRIDGISHAVSRCFGTSESAPREIIGITIVRRNAGRARSGLEKTFVPVALRLDVATGKCELRYAHERGGRLSMSNWLAFSRGLGEIAGISPVCLADEQTVRRTRFMQFCEAVIGESVDAQAAPVVIIDSSNCVKLWGWLADSRISASNVEIAEREWMQDEWRGARIVRVRQELAPGVIVDKVRRLTPYTPAELNAGPPKRCKRLKVPTSPSGALYRLRTAATGNCVTYLSVGAKTLHKNKRGLSCYRPVLLDAKAGTAGSEGEKLFTLRRCSPFVDQWPTPNPIEIVVALRNESDEPDRIAEFVETLRYGFGHYGEWTSLPAPLFFERVIRDYISGFTLAGEEESETEG